MFITTFNGFWFSGTVPFCWCCVQFGGGRNLKPGEALETAEEKAAKEARTRQLIAEYKRKTGMNIDAKLKSECEEVCFCQILCPNCNLVT